MLHLLYEYQYAISILSCFFCYTYFFEIPAFVKFFSTECKMLTMYPLLLVIFRNFKTLISTAAAPIAPKLSVVNVNVIVSESTGVDLPLALATKIGDGCCSGIRCTSKNVNFEVPTNLNKELLH